MTHHRSDDGQEPGRSGWAGQRAPEGCHSDAGRLSTKRTISIRWKGGVRSPFGVRVAEHRARSSRPLVAQLALAAQGRPHLATPNTTPVAGSGGSLGGGHDRRGAARWASTRYCGRLDLWAEWLSHEARIRHVVPPRMCFGEFGNQMAAILRKASRASRYHVESDGRAVYCSGQ